MGSRPAGLVLITLGVVFLIFNYSLRLDFLSCLLVFPTLMVLFGLLKIAVGVFNLNEYKGYLDFIIFVWLVLTFFAYGAPLFNVSHFLVPTQTYSQDFDLSQVQTASVHVGAGKITVQTAVDSLLIRCFGDQPEVGNTTATLSVDVGAGDVTLSMDRDRVAGSTLVLDTGVGGIDVLSTHGFRNISAHTDVGSIDIHVPSGVEYSIHYSIGLGSFSGETSCHLSCSGAYTTDGYESAEDKIDISADVGVGSVTVHRT